MKQPIHVAAQLASERPLLSIAIPTYNRAVYLDQLLGALLEQARGETRIELIVSDNASSDNTRELVMSYGRRALQIRYHRNSANRGADFNILQCFTQASGKYVWIFADDDLIAPGTISRVLQALSARDYDLVYINSYSFRGAYGRHKDFATRPDLEVESLKFLASYVNVFFTFISANIINRDRALSLPHAPFEGLVGTNLVQLGWVYTVLNHHRKSLIIRDPLVAARGGNTGGYGLCRVFGPGLVRVTEEWLQKRSIQRVILNGTLVAFFPHFILPVRESRGTFDAENPDQILRGCFSHNFRYWVFDYPICVLPMPLAKAWRLGTKIVNRLDRLLGRPLIQ
jgi:abequosyltransferase